MADALPNSWFEDGHADDLLEYLAAQWRTFMGVIDFEVLRVAEQISGDRKKALAWYRQPLLLFDHQTPEQLVNAGRKTALLRYLWSLEAGPLG